MGDVAWAAVLNRYANRVHALVGARHHVASPLGAWLIVALAGTAGDGAEVSELTEALGAEPAAAADLASRLVQDPHPLVGCGAALWHRVGQDSARFAAWRTSLPSEIETGDIPSQEALDAWAELHTRGLINEFPLTITPQTVLVMATALATKVSWDRPFDLIDATALGPASSWSSALRQVLAAPPGGLSHQQFITETARAGAVAVHMAKARGGLTVTSVIAGHEVETGDVLAAAHTIATTEAVEPNSVVRRSLFDLPLGDSDQWRITEEPAQTPPNGRDERCEAVLPAWSAKTDLDLGGPALARHGRRRFGACRCHRAQGLLLRSRPNGGRSLYQRGLRSRCRHWPRGPSERPGTASRHTSGRHLDLRAPLRRRRRHLR